MGVFTVGRQVALEIDMPGWWLANASVDMDFRRGLYYDSSTANPRAATDFLSCTRASIGYAKNADGTLTQFASNALRIGNGTGLLVEDARTNIILQSQTLTIWSQNEGTTSADTTTAPDGTTTADTFTESANNGAHTTYQDYTSTAVPWTGSIFLKKKDRNFGWLTFDNQTNVNRVIIVIDLTTGAITDTHTVGSPTNVTTRVETFANGWFRLSITLDGSANTATIGCGPSDSATPSYTPTNVIYTGDGTSGIYIWGGQVEAGAFPSSYIPTTGAAATRAAENITTSGSLQTAINNATGSLVAQTDNGGGASFAANIVDSNGTNLLGFDASNHALASMVGTLATANNANRTTQDKLGLAWNASGRSLVLNGGTVATDASAQTPSATQHIGSSGTANFAYAYIERLSAWTTKLANATLQGFTV